MTLAPRGLAKHWQCCVLSVWTLARIGSPARAQSTSQRSAPTSLDIMLLSASASMGSWFLWQRLRIPRANDSTARRQSLRVRQPEGKEGSRPCQASESREARWIWFRRSRIREVPSFQGPANLREAAGASIHSQGLGDSGRGSWVPINPSKHPAVHWSLGDECGTHAPAVEW